MRLETMIVGNGSRRIGLVHGLGVDASTWEPFIEQLRAAGDVTVFAPDPCAAASDNRWCNRQQAGRPPFARRCPGIG